MVFLTRVPTRAALLIVTLLALSGAHPPRAQANEEGETGVRPGVIVVDMTGFRSDKGAALVALFTSPSGFPDRPAKARARRLVPIRNHAARAWFRRLPPGTYAIGVLHDEDGDRKMRTGALRIPQEGYGASRDARGRFGPPRFEDARLSLRSGQTLRTPIKMIYH